MKNLLFLTLFFGFASSILGQDGFVQGIVEDAILKESIIGANVKVINKDVTKFDVTDVDGKFGLKLPIGQYKLIVSFIGFKSDTTEVVVKKGEVSEISVLLQETSTQLADLVIEGNDERQEILESTISKEVISPSLIENKNASSVTAVLDQTPGLNILDGDPQIRGGSGFTFGVGSRVQVVVDGIPMLSGDAGRPQWEFVPIENLEQIEVIKGASSVLYSSSAINGVIDISTAKPSIKPKTVFNYSIGAYDSPNAPYAKWWDKSPHVFTNLSLLHSRIIKNNLDFTIGANYNFDQGYIGSSGDLSNLYVASIDSLSDYSQKQMNKQRARANFGLRYRPEKIKGLSFGLNGNLMVAKDNMPLAWLDDSSGIYRSYPGAILLQDQLIYNIDPYVILVSNHNLKQTLNTRYFNSSNEMTDNKYIKSELFYAEYRLSKQFNAKKDGIKLTSGALISYGKVNSNMYEGSGSDINKTKNIAAYTQLEKLFWKRLKVNAGLRMEYFDINGEDSSALLEPILRGGLSYKITNGTYARASYGQGLRYPTIAEKYIKTTAGGFIGVFQNNAIQPEKSESFEVGVKQGFKIKDTKFGGFIDVAGFWQNYENTIEYLFGIWGLDEEDSETPVGFKFLNTGPSTVKGTEISITLGGELNKKNKITLIAGYTYILPTVNDTGYVFTTSRILSDTKEHDLTYNNTSLNPENGILKYRFRHTVKIDVEYTYVRFSFGISSRYYSYMENIDKAILDFETLTALDNDVLELQQYPDILYTKFRQEHDKGTLIFDARFGYEFKKGAKVSVIVNNVLNDTYSLRPLKVEPMRNFAIQYLHKF